MENCPCCVLLEGAAVQNLLLIMWQNYKRLQKEETSKQNNKSNFNY